MQWEEYTQWSPLPGSVIGGHTSVVGGTIVDAPLPDDVAVTLGRRDTGWERSPAFYVIRLPLHGPARLYYAPDTGVHETWVYRVTPDLDARREVLGGVVEAGGLAGLVDGRRMGSMVGTPLWATIRADCIDSWMVLDGPRCGAALDALGAVEELIPEATWADLARRRAAWQAERDRAAWTRGQRAAMVAGLRVAGGGR